MTHREAIIETLLDVNWEPLAEVLQEHGQAWVRARVTSNGVELEAIAPGQVHCATCQCNKLHDTTVRAPGNPHSKTWHW